jgi:Clp amino terminal domain, pathogenicity island component
MKFKHFTERAGQVILAAEREARAFNHNYVGTEHILLGLLDREGKNVSEIFYAFGVTAEQMRAEVEKLVQRGSSPIVTDQLPLTPRAKQAVNYAIEEATNLNQKQVDVEHLLLGLLREPDGVAGLALRNLGLGIEKIGPEVFKIRLMQMKIVERAVRPVRASLPRKRKMREELLAHLAAIHEEEMAKLNDSAAALAEANRRFGDSKKLARELESSLPWSERLSFAVERHLGWRAPESAARYCMRLGFNFAICMACCIALPLLIESLLINQYNTADWWSAMRVCGLFLFWLPVCVAVLTWIYLQLRDAMWGAFGSRKSALRVAAFAGVMVAFMFVFTLLFLAIEAWSLGAAGFWPGRAALAAVGVAIFYIINARLSGPKEISNTIWASLKIEN